MAQTADLARTGYEGAVYCAPSATAAPTGISALASAWDEVGFISEDGVTVAHSDDYTELKAWQRATIVRKTLTQSDVTFQFQMIETNKTAVELYYKAELESGDMELKEGSPKPVRQSFVIDVIDGENVHRMYLPDAEVTERGELQFVNDDLVKYDVTITAYEKNGIRVHHWWKQALVPGGAGAPLPAAKVAKGSSKSD